MKKLLLIGAGIVVAMLVLLWHELRAPSEAAAAVAVVAPKAETPAAAPRIAPAPVALPAALAPPPPSEDGKVNINGDDFFDRFVERQPKAASRAAMSCYRGGLAKKSMDAWITIAFVGHIKGGEVTFTDVRAKDSHLDDQALEDCMLAAVRAAHWHDDSLPDVDSYPDTTTLTPERGGKKYMHPRDDNATPAPANTPR